MLERYSDSAGSYVRLDSDNTAVYKQLFRAAKAKSKLRIKVTTIGTSVPAPTQVSASETSPPRHNYLETVLTSPIPVAYPETLTTTTITPATTSQPTSSDIPPSSLSSPSNQPQYRSFDMEENKRHFSTIAHTSPSGMFCIDCNNCGGSIANEHYHCSICEHGDYDLCPECLDAGASCLGEGHWLIKRVVQGGLVTPSTTETIPPRQKSAQQTRSVAPVVPLPETKLVPEMAGPPIPIVAAPASTPASSKTLGPDMATQVCDKPICNGCCRGMCSSLAFASITMSVI